MTLAEYIQDKQEVIDAFLKYENENGECIVDIKTIAKEIKKSITSVKNKIKQINEIDNVIQLIGYDKEQKKNIYKINIKNFYHTKHVYNIELVIDELIKDEKAWNEKQKILAKKLNVRITDIKRVKDGIIIPNYYKNNKKK